MASDPPEDGKPSDQSVAAVLESARSHITRGEHAQAIAAADTVLAQMLSAHASVERFVERALSGAAPEDLLRYSRADIARMPHFRAALALRWEALRRAGQKSEAVAMRELCLRYWPERVSVWEAAGGHALDDTQPDQALAYFERALSLDPTSTRALAGKAIAHEMRKEWSAALDCRREVAELEKAFAGEDAASLHRVLRYAANLGRLGRWREATPHFQRAALCGAFGKVPHERPALLRIFAGELYAPSLIVAFGREAGELPDAVPLRMAVRDAQLLQGFADRIAGQAALDPHDRAIALAMLALQAGHLRAAYRVFDEADEAREDDMVVNHLLCSSALELGADDAASIADFALRLARREREAGASGERGFYAALTLARAGEPQALSQGIDEPFAALIAQLAAGPLDLAALAALAERWCARPTEREAIHAWTALREACIALGYPQGVGALACARLRASAA